MNYLTAIESRDTSCRFSAVECLTRTVRPSGVLSSNHASFASVAVAAKCARRAANRRGLPRSQPLPGFLNFIGEACDQGAVSLKRLVQWRLRSFQAAVIRVAGTLGGDGLRLGYGCEPPL